MVILQLMMQVCTGAAGRACASVHHATWHALHTAQGHNMNPWQSLKLMSLPASAMLVLMACVVELKDMVAKNAGGPTAACCCGPAAHSWALGAGAIVMGNMPFFVAAGSLGLAVNVLSNVIIKLSSATSVKLLAAVRGPLVVVSGVLLFAETVREPAACVVLCVLWLHTGALCCLGVHR